MKARSHPKLKRYLDHLARHRLTLHGFAGVTHIDVGFRYVGGKPTDQLAIRLFIKGRKGGRRKELAPRSYRGVPIDIIRGSFELQKQCSSAPAGPIQRAEPLVGGVSLGTQLAGPGTLGVCIRTDKYPGTLLMTADHVANENDAVYQPSSRDSPAARLVGAAVASNGMLGYALVRTTAAAALGAVQGLGVVREIVSQEAAGAAVGTRQIYRKAGRTTGVTQAVIDGIDPYDVITLVPANLRDRPISCGGDSGSIWMSDSGAALGLHYAGDGAGAFALAKAMYAIDADLGLHFGA